MDQQEFIRKMDRCLLAIVIISTLSVILNVVSLWMRYNP